MADPFTECWKCKSPNPSSNRFCGACGAELNSAIAPFKEVIQATVRDEIRSSLKDQLKDQKLLELETADQVQTRVFAWVKNVGLLLGVALAIAGFGLSWLGTSTWKDIKASAENSMNQVVAKRMGALDSDFQGILKERENDASEQLRKEVANSRGTLQKDQESAEQSFKQARERADTLNRQVQSQLEDTNKRVNAIEERLSTMTVNLFDGARRPVPQDLRVLITLRDGNQKEVFRNWTTGPTLTFKVPFNDNFGDMYSVIIFADGYQQVGLAPVKVSDQYAAHVDLMLLPTTPVYRFEVSPFSGDLLTRLGTNPAQLSTLEATAPDRAAMLMNTLAIASGIHLSRGHQPQGSLIDVLRKVDWNHLTAAHMVAYADARLVELLSVSMGAHALQDSSTSAIGKTYQWTELTEAPIRIRVEDKETQLVDGIDCVKVTLSFAYSKDLEHHSIIELVTNATNGELPDPKTVYLLRWLSSRKAANPEFDPGFALVSSREPNPK